MSKPDPAPNRKWTNPVMMTACEIHCPSTCVALGPVLTNSDSKLICAHGGNRGMNLRLTVFSGLSQEMEATLADPPTQIMHFVNEKSTMPNIAVAAGPSVLVYKNLKPFYKFTVATSPINPTEEEAWKAVALGKINHNTLMKVLQKVTEDVAFSKLTPISQTYMLSDKEDQLALIEKWGGKITNCPTITCITKILKSKAEGLDIMVIATEHCDIFFLDSQAFTTLHHFKLPSVPVVIRGYGEFDVDWRLFVQTRDSLIYNLKRDTTELRPTIICQSMITSLILLNKFLVYTTNDNIITFSSFRGKKINTVKCTEKIKMLEPFFYEHKQLSAVIAVFEKKIRMYNETHLLDTVEYQKPLNWVRYGMYGREDSTLVVCFKDGTIAIQIFRRNADFRSRTNYNEAPASHALKLQIPKKTKVFIDNTEREKKLGVKIHQAYQKHLFNLRFKIAESYQTLTASAITTVSTTSVLPVEIAVDINGFGPRHRMSIRLLSSSKQNLYDMHLSMISDIDVYEFDTPLIPISILASGKPYTFTTLLRCKDPEKSATSEVRALLVHTKRATPIVTAVIKMPFSEFAIE
ncbi:unnamed protein product [Caenorhabditis nigoni]